MQKGAKFVATFFVAVFLGVVPVRAQWSEPAPVEGLVNTQYDEGMAFPSFDGQRLYFTKQYTDSFYFGRIYEAKRQGTSGPYTSVTEVLQAGWQEHAYEPWVSPDNLRIYYFGEIIGGWVIRFSERADVNSTWPTGTNISELNALGDVRTPRLTADELTIFFDSTNIAGGMGGYDIWMATRPNRGSPFGNVTNLTEINTSANESLGSISSDGLTLYFCSDSNGVNQLFMATRDSLDEPFETIEHIPFFASWNFGHPCFNSNGTALYFTHGGPGDILVSYKLSPLEVAIGHLEDALADKQEALNKIDAALAKEQAACDEFGLVLQNGDYGSFRRRDIMAARQDIDSAMRFQEHAADTVDKSIARLVDALTTMGWQPPPPPPDPNI